MTLGTCCYLIRRYGLRDAWHAWRCGREWRKAWARKRAQIAKQKAAMWEIMRR